MRQGIVVLCALTALAACNQSAEQPANNAAANSAQAARRPSFCFFKDEETKDWKASVATGKVTVTGKAHVKDSRYRAQLGEAEIAGKTATLPLSITTNMTGYGAADDWWDVSGEVPAAAGLESVSVTCGDKTLAELPLKKG